MPSELDERRLRVMQFELDDFGCLLDFADGPRLDSALDALEKPRLRVTFQPLDVQIEEIADVGARHVAQPGQHLVGAHRRRCNPTFDGCANLGFFQQPMTLRISSLFAVAGLNRRAARVEVPKVGFDKGLLFCVCHTPSTNQKPA